MALLRKRHSRPHRQLLGAHAAELHDGEEKQNKQQKRERDPQSRPASHFPSRTRFSNDANAGAEGGEVSAPVPAPVIPIASRPAGLQRHKTQGGANLDALLTDYRTASAQDTQTQAAIAGALLAYRTGPDQDVFTSNGLRLPAPVRGLRLRRVPARAQDLLGGTPGGGQDDPAAPACVPGAAWAGVRWQTQRSTHCCPPAKHLPRTGP